MLPYKDSFNVYNGGALALSDLFVRDSDMRGGTAYHALLEAMTPCVYVCNVIKKKRNNSDSRNIVMARP